MERDDIGQASPKEEIVGMVMQELNTLRQRVAEIKAQIESMQNQVEREQGRYSSIVTELRAIKENLDTTPREDIRDKYDEALEVRFRLATMRGQLEKFEANYDNLTQEQELLNNVVKSLQGVDFGTADGQTVVQSSGSLDIVGIIRAQEQERQRLARAMHDGPAQSLTNFILQAEICQRLFERNTERAAEELNNLKTNASKTFQKVRDFIFDLRPMMLDDLGVAPTVRRYVESYHEKNDIEVKLQLYGEDRRLENYREVMIFRAIQDVMSGARDYSSPTEMSVSLDMSTDTIRIVIEDNGRGFDAEQIFSNDEEAYSDARIEALRVQKARFELIGGSIDVRSDENSGSTVRLELPATG